VSVLLNTSQNYAVLNSKFSFHLSSNPHALLRTHYPMPNSSKNTPTGTSIATHGSKGIVKPKTDPLNGEGPAIPLKESARKTGPKQ
jgi:hypothetical protein